SVYHYSAGTAGSNPADGGWANLANGSMSYAFTVPTDSSATVTYGIPAGGYENGSSATISVNGQMVATVSGTGVTSGDTPQATSPVTLWQQTFGPGTYMVSISGNFVNVYGLWISGQATPLNTTATA
ncbi:MAG: hypothetical protein OWU33_16785, partial [Firmicutes bacterium]|nr:hypothetical protein [Bacillota bacterium]